MKSKILSILMLLIAYSFEANSQVPTDRMMIFAKYFTTSSGEVQRDGTISVYKNGFCNCYNGDDAVKLGGSWGISSNGQILSVEARDTVLTIDTVRFHQWAYLDVNNMIDFTVTTPLPTNVIVTLRDTYLATSTNISIVNGVHTKYYYSTNANPLSYVPNRFYMTVDNPAGYVEPPTPTIAKEFNVYPNPISSGQDIYIEYADSIQHEFYLVSITGNVKHKLGKVQSRTTVKVPVIEKGTYILYDVTGKQNKKILVL